MYIAVFVGHLKVYIAVFVGHLKVYKGKFTSVENVLSYKRYFVDVF